MNDSEKSKAQLIIELQKIRQENTYLKQSEAERKNVEQTPKTSEYGLRALFKAMTDLVFEIDYNGTYLNIAPTSPELMVEPATGTVGKTLHDVFAKPEADKFLHFIRKCLDENKINTIEYPVTIHKKLLWFEGRATPKTPNSVLYIARDITERKQAETENAKLKKQLHRSQKLETIGTLAGGIAHDFNNILTPIIGYAELGLLSLLPANPVFENFKHILTGSNRAKELVEQILLFSRQIEKERRPLSLHLLVKEALKLLRSSIPATIEIQQRIDTSCAKILADPAQLHQVIVNLCTNAFQAMEEKGGTLTIDMKQVEVDDTTAKIYPNLEKKEYVQLTIRDTGIGMDDTTIDHIFEPFFTTKAVGKGTGLGLSVTYGIVRSHHGDILVNSEPGRGSAFHVYLPTTQQQDVVEDLEKQAMQGGHESILIVDDEKAVTAMLKRMLEWLGYSVCVQNNSQEALKFFQQHPDTFALVLTDLTMPLMTGLDLAKELHKLRPELPIILMTGYGESIATKSLKSHGVETMLGKPIEIKKMATAIRTTLDK